MLRDVEVMPGNHSATADCTILVIEDDRKWQEFLSHIPEKSSLHPVRNIPVASVEEGLDTLRAHSVDAILLDLNMAKSADIDTLRNLREQHPEIPVIIFTEQEEEHVALTAIRNGAQDYLVKGKVQPEAISHAILKAIERKILDRHEVNREQENRNLVEARYRDLVRQLPAITYILDPDRNFETEYISPQVETLLGFSPEEWQANPDLWTSQIHPKDHECVSNARNHFHLTGNDLAITYRMHSKNGEEVWFKDHARLFVDTQGHRFIHGLLLDITQIRAAELRLQKRDQQFLQRQKMSAVGRLAGGIAHEFNNLLTSILGFSYLMVEETEEDNPLKEYAQQIIESGERATDLIRQMLAFSNKKTNRIENFHANDLLTNLRKLLDKTLRPGIELRLHAEAEADFIRGDKNLLEQVIINLCDNAQDAIEEHGIITIITRNHLVDGKEAKERKCEPGTYICFTVIDDGEGIDQEDLDKIYDPFFSKKEVGHGVGLGLSIVYTNVEQYNGHLDLQSTPGKGTEINVYLPLCESEEETKAVEIENLPRGRETILLVEDETSIRKLSTHFLESLGYHVLSAGNGDEAILIVESYKKPIHLLLTDIVMPKLNGIQLADQLRKEQGRFKVLYTSGHDQESISANHEDVFETNFLQKPYRRDKLAFMVRGALDSE